MRPDQHTVTTLAVLGAAASAAAGVTGGGRAGGLAWAATAGFAAASASVVATRSHRRVALCCALVAVGLGAFADAAWRARADEHRLLPRLAARRDEASACGLVLRGAGRSVEVQARTVTSGGRTWRVREPAIIALRPGSLAPRVRPGERVCGKGTLRRSRSGAVVLTVDAVRRAGVASPLRLAAASVRERYAEAARRVLPARQAGLLLGMTEGDTSLLDDATVESFRTTGLAHIVAVSGSNVAALLSLVTAGSRLLVRRGRWLRVALAAPALVFFAFLTGLEPSVLRAVVTAGLVLVVTASGRPTDGLRVAGLAFIGLVLASPRLLAQPGFRLSFAATAGLILWGGRLADAVARALGDSPDRPRRTASLAGAAVGTTLAAQMAVAPLLAVEFGRLPAVGAFANLVVVPLADVVMIGGTATLTVAWLVPALAWAPATMRLVLEVILGAAGAFAALPMASVAVTPAVGVVIAAAFAAVLARSGRARALTLAAAVLAAGVAGGRSAAGSTAPCGDAEVRAIDVGEGTAVLLRDDGHAVLADGGPASGGVVRALSRLGVRRLDLLLASHPHADHVDGLRDVVRRRRAARLAGPSTLGLGSGAALLQDARRVRMPVSVLAAGDELRAGPIRVEILAPARDDPAPDAGAEVSYDEVNARNLIVRASVGGLTVLLTGDVNAEGTRDLLASGAVPSATVLVAPHHGSADLDEEFVSAVGAKLTVVTVGPNPYGHPTPRAMRIYATSGHVVRTDRDGSVAICETDGQMTVATHA